MTSSSGAQALDPRALLAFAGMTLIWGSTWYAIHLQLNGTPIFVSVTLRFLLAAMVLGAWMTVARIPFRLPRAVWAWVPWQASCIYGVNYLFAYAATEYVVSGVVALAFALNVVFSLLAEPWLLKRRSPASAWLGAALGIAGLALVLAPGLVLRSETSSMLGVFYALAGAAIVGIGALISAKVMAQGAAPATLNFYGFLIGSVIAAAAALLSGKGFAVHWSTTYVASLLYLALLGSITAFALYLFVVRSIGPVAAGYSSILSPLIALALSMWLEGFRADLGFALGVGLVLLGNAVIIRGRTPKPRTT